MRPADLQRGAPGIGIDVGGTFTDFVVAEPSGLLHFHKEPSTPADPSLAVARGLAALVERCGLRGHASRIVHGTTLALNAVLQRRGARIALVVSRGTRDVLEIARCRMPSSFNFLVGKEEPLVPRDRVLEVDARTGADGTVLRRPAAVEVEALCRRLASLEVEAVAIMLLNSYLDDTLETEIAGAIAARMPDLLVTQSARIWPEIREYERAVAACLNAQIQPLMDRYLATLESRLAALGISGRLFITASSGGTLGVGTARERPIETILSGPASGVMAAARLSQQAGETTVIAFDMGGTSADISVIRDGAPDFTTATQVGEVPIMLPVVAVASIGAGGGSIVSVDRQAVLKVGPESAGAEPGPVAYDRGGTRPTITDCYLATGLLDAHGFLGGRIPLDRGAADRALAGIAVQVGLAGPAEAAEAALRVAAARMATEFFKLLAQKGLDPREHVLMPFGGAGPTHANLLAAEAGLAGIVIPPAASTFCALGAVLSDLRRDLVRGVRRAAGDLDGEVWAGFATLEAEAAAWITAEAADVLDTRREYRADMRYSGQSHNLVVTIPPEVRRDRDGSGLREQFHRLHESLYGFREVDAAVEILTLRLGIVGRVPTPALPRLPTEGRPPEPRGRRRVFHDGGWRDATVFRREDLPAGAVFNGPAIVEQDDTTIWVLPGWRAAVDAFGNLRVARTARQ